MALTEYANIASDADGIESVYRYKIIDSEVVATYKAPKRALLRPVTRQPDPAVNPLTETLGPEIVTIGADSVTIHREAVPVSNDVRAGRCRAEAQRRIDALDARRRERVQMEMLRLCSKVTLGGTLTAPETTRLTKLREWVVYWVAVHKHGEDLAADPNLPVGFPAEPAGGAP